MKPYPAPLPQGGSYSCIVVGGGPAGLAAALAAAKQGLDRVLLLERNHDLGGILNQCIHNGFGLHYFKQELTGPEYAERFTEALRETNVEVLCNAMVLAVTPQKQVCVVHPEKGYMELNAQTVILAMGCRERTRGAIGIPGTRPAGVFTAGAAQLYMNIEGKTVGKRAVILGSGDIGLIMARRLTLEGAKVLGVYELMPYSGGLTRNIVQCLEDYDIPLLLSHTVTQIHGEKRLEGVTVARVDENRNPLPGTEQYLECDTLLLSVGLIPENELSRGAGAEIDPRTGGPVVYENMETSLPGVFACGNVAHVHDLVDFVTAESERAGFAAARYCAAAGPQGLDSPMPGTAGHPAATPGDAAGASPQPGGPQPAPLRLRSGAGVSYTVPQRIRPLNAQKSVDVLFRVTQVFPQAQIVLQSGGETLASFKRSHLAPGEMERITLPAALLAKVRAGEAELLVKEDA